MKLTPEGYYIAEIERLNQEFRHIFSSHELTKDANGDYIDPETAHDWQVFQMGLHVGQEFNMGDARRMASFCAELDLNRRDSAPMPIKMPIWDAMCDAIGNDCSGDKMRAAIDKACSLPLGVHHEKNTRISLCRQYSPRWPPYPARW